MNIRQAIESKALLGGLSHFRGGLAPWRNWLIVWSAIFGLPLTPDEEATFCKFTGRSRYAPPVGGWRTIALCLGRRSGKSSCAAILAAYTALAAGQSARDQSIVVVAQDLRSGTANLFNAISEPFDTIPAISKTVKNKTANPIELRSGLWIRVLPCRPNALRGYASPLVICDEIAHAASKTGAPVDRDLIRAGLPTLATVPNSKLCVLSSPAGASGYLYDTITEHWGRDESPVLCVRGASYEFNPAIPEWFLAEMRRDHEAWETEIEGNFAQSSVALFDSKALGACVVTGRSDIPPSACRGPVRCAVDPSSGRLDRFAAALGYREGGRVVVAAVRLFSPPFSPAGVVQEIAALCREYGVRRVTGDRFAGAFVSELFQQNGIAYDTSSLTASEHYLNALACVQSGGIELPDPAVSDTAAELLSELRGIERRPGGTGPDRADIRRGSGRVGHGDGANATCLLISLLPAKPERRRVPFDLSLASLKTPFRPPTWMPGEDKRFVLPGVVEYADAA